MQQEHAESSKKRKTSQDVTADDAQLQQRQRKTSQEHKEDTPARAFQLDLARAFHTLKFVDVMRGPGTLTQRMKNMCDLLDEDSLRADSLLDMSLNVDNNEVRDGEMLFFLLLCTRRDHSSYQPKKRFVCFPPARLVLCALSFI